MIVGIDATNMRRGGGITHLEELLNALEPATLGVKRVVVWGGTSLLNALEDRQWLDKSNPSALNKGLLKRTFWQYCNLSNAVRDAKCDVLLVPGGSYAGNFHPVVIMSQNLLPFELHELWRYGWTFFTLKLLLLRLTQSLSFKKADGIIFLTDYAYNVVLKVTGKLCAQSSIVPHGVNQRFNKKPNKQRDITDYDDTCPYRVLYVSIIDQYKHQWHVVRAISILRQQGLPIVLDLVGPAYPPSLKQLNAEIRQQPWVSYHGAIVFNELHQQYAKADLGLFASSCENMPNILLETMASGLPIACSNKGPMPEMLGNAGLYFDPEKPEEIAGALLTLIKSPSLRTELAQASYARAQEYSWKRCANETFGFLNAVVQEYKRKL